MKPGPVPPGRVTLGDLLRQAKERLAAAQIDQPHLDASILAANQFQLDRAQLISRSDWTPPPEQIAGFLTAIDRRANREPVSRILGRREFWSLDFALGPDTLDPRPDTETLIETILGQFPDRAAPLRILDLGTGSGCILLALLAEYRAAWGVGIDLSPAACRIAADNAERLGLRERTAWLVGDWSAALQGRFDVVVSNPPYIPSADLADLAPEVRQYDPARALDGGIDGLTPYPIIARQAAQRLVPGGVMAAEHGVGQSDAVTDILQQAGFQCIETIADMTGRNRVVIGRRP